MKTKDMCLIITGTITPPKDVFQLYLTDSEERKKQYISSIRYYIENTKIQKIIYCDNSGTDEDSNIKEMAIKKGKRLEWLSFTSDVTKVRKQGKGFGEGEIMKFIFSNSLLIRECKSFAKVTGRLIVKNIDAVIFTSSINHIYCDIVNNYVQTYFYIMPTPIYKSYFLNAYQQVNDRSGYFLEHCFYTTLKEKNIRYRLFSLYPNIIGQSGSTGGSYELSYWQRLKKNIKGTLFNIKAELRNLKRVNGVKDQ